MDSEGKPLDPPEVIETKGLPLNDAVKKILGKAGTKVKLTVEREGVDKPFNVEITRGRVEVETVLGVKRKPERRVGLHDRRREQDRLRAAEQCSRTTPRATSST